MSRLGIGLGFGLSAPTQGVPAAAWLASRGWAGSVAGADFERGKFWLPTLPAGSIVGASADQLVPRWATEAEWRAQYTAAGTIGRTYIDGSGVIRNDLAANALRYTYDGGRRWLVLEDASTNLLKGSADLTNASYWSTLVSGTGTSLSNGTAGTAPDGTTTAALFTINRSTTAGDARFYQNFTGTVAAYTGSFYVKAATGAAVGKVIQALFYDSTANLTATDITLTATWQRVTVAGTLKAGTCNLSIGYIGSAGAGTGSVSFYAWGADVEAQSFASSYIPTTSAAVARPIETFRLPAVVEALLQRTEAMMLVRCRLERVASPGEYPRILGTGGNNTPLFYLSDMTRVSSYNGSVQVNSTTIASIRHADIAAASAYSAAGMAVSLNGGAVMTSSGVFGAGVFTTVWLARSGTVGGSSPYANGLYNALVLFPTRDAARMPTLAATGW